MYLLRAKFYATFHFEEAVWFLTINLVADAYLLE